ncbi:MAG: TlpA family protein disulfide reductase [Acidobacteria bacterium]|nr:TlpA family protein disulfide reductase [Acidobacteriota bacterium]
MQEQLRITLSVVVATLAAVACGTQYARGVDATLVDTQARPSRQQQIIRFLRNPAPVPSFTARDLDGRMISPAEWRGKVVLINFWATWCPPCRAEIPELIALQAEYRGQLQIIGVSEDEGSLEAVERFVGDYKISYPIVVSSPELRNSFPDVFGLPTTFVLDRSTRIVQKHVGLLKITVVETETRALAGLPVNAVIE